MTALLTRNMLAASVAGAFAAGASAATLDHYWDMDTLTGGTPTDVASGAATTAIDTSGLGTDVLLLNQAFGAAYAGAGNALQTNLAGVGSRHLSAAMGDLTTYGQFDWAISYWSYNADDGDVRGPRVLDSLLGTSEGFQFSATGSDTDPASVDSILNLRIDSVGGGSSLSKDTLTTTTQARDAWTSVVINYTAGTDTVEVFFNGISQGTYTGNVTGAINHTQDMEIGVINGGNGAGTAQGSALDDLAFYTGRLSAAEITGLANGTITPLDVPEPGSLALLGLGGLALLRRRRA